MPSNITRANRAKFAIEKYDDDDARYNAVDLIADVMHWCDYEDLGFERILQQARRHYEAETTSEATAFGDGV